MPPGRRLTAAPAPPPIQYSPSAARTRHFCEKKYYFSWLAKRRQGWRKPEDHPWHQVHLLNQVKHRPMWAGDLYHQVMAQVLQQATRAGHVDEATTRRVARGAAAAQFAFSAAGTYAGVRKSRVETYEGIPTFLALFDHVYGLPTDGTLEETQAKLDQWLAHTFAWEGWPVLLQRLRRARQVHIEPVTLHYSIGGARIQARMDLGLEEPAGRFQLYDWKCYRDDERFAEYDERLFRHQLLTYALWPVLREAAPLRLDSVVACLFNPISGEEREVRFTEDDRADFELEVAHWARLHGQVYTGVSDVEFEDLRGPYDPGRSCPWCPLKGVCGKEIVWHELS